MRTDELSLQQKLWKGGEILAGSLKPVALYLFLPPVLASFGMVLFGGRDGQQVLADSGNFYYALGIAAAMWILRRQSKKRGTTLWQESGTELENISWKRAGLLAVLGLGSALAFSAVITAAPLPSALTESYRASSNMGKKGTDQFLAMICTVFMAPAAEEIVFRGYMLGRLLRWFDRKTAIVLSAAVFALCHVSLLWMVYACFMGILLGWVSVREDNTLYSVILHIGFNLSVIPVDLINSAPAWREILFKTRLRIALIGTAACVLAIWAFVRYTREEIQ